MPCCDPRSPADGKRLGRNDRGGGSIGLIKRQTALRPIGALETTPAGGAVQGWRFSCHFLRPQTQERRGPCLAPPTERRWSGRNKAHSLVVRTVGACPPASTTISPLSAIPPLWCDMVWTNPKLRVRLAVLCRSTPV